MFPTRLRVLIITLVLGLMLRGDGLGLKAYGNDEATTSLRVAGATLQDYARLFNGQAYSVAQLKTYQERVPGTSVADVNRSLRSEDPQHPPFYYDLERFWLQWDHGVVGHRRLSVVAGVLLIPVMGWLVLELSGSSFASLIGMTLVAVSPFFVLYSQQAREYALWAVLTAASTALLARILTQARQTPYTWISYGVLLTLGLLTDLLFVGVLIAHAVAVLAARYRDRRLGAWLVQALAVALFAFLWLPALLANQGAVTNNAFLAMALAPKVFAAKWLVNLSTLVVDFGLLPTAYAPRSIALVGMALAGLSLLGLGASWYYALRRLDADRRIILGALIIIPALILLLPDLVHHESRSTAARYLLPTFIGLEALLALGLAALAERSKLFGGTLLGLVLLSGVLSASARRSVPAWWTDWSAYGVVPIAVAIDRLPPQAEIVAFGQGDGWDFTVMELVNRLDDARRFRLYQRVQDVPKGSSLGGYLLNPSEQELRTLQQIGRKLRRIELGATQMGPGLFVTKKTSTDQISQSPLSLWEMLPIMGLKGHVY